MIPRIGRDRGEADGDYRRQLPLHIDLGRSLAFHVGIPMFARQRVGCFAYTHGSGGPLEGAPSPNAQVVTAKMNGVVPCVFRGSGLLVCDATKIHCRHGLTKSKLKFRRR